MKCSGSLTEIYCSSECHKLDWKIQREDTENGNRILGCHFNVAEYRLSSKIVNKASELAINGILYTFSANVATRYYDLANIRNDIKNVCYKKAIYYYTKESDTF